MIRTCELMLSTLIVSSLSQQIVRWSVKLFKVEPYALGIVVLLQLPHGLFLHQLLGVVKEICAVVLQKD